MEYNDGNNFLKWGIVAISGIVGVSSYYVLKLPEDNPIEEVSEEIIKSESGFDVDLSPRSIEKGK